MFFAPKLAVRQSVASAIRCQMRTTGRTAGVILARGALTTGAAFDSAQKPSVSRVEPFEHLYGPETLTDGAGESPTPEFFPDVTETCRKYLEYTEHFVRNATIRRATGNC